MHCGGTCAVCTNLKQINPPQWKHIMHRLLIPIGEVASIRIQRLCIRLLTSNVMTFFYIPLLSTTRGHSCKIQHKCIPHRACRYHFFSNRVIHMWNSLPQHIVTAKDVKVFSDMLRVKCKPFPPLHLGPEKDYYKVD